MANYTRLVADERKAGISWLSDKLVKGSINQETREFHFTPNASRYTIQLKCKGIIQKIGESQFEICYWFELGYDNLITAFIANIAFIALVWFTGFSYWRLFLAVAAPWIYLYVVMRYERAGLRYALKKIASKI